MNSNQSTFLEKCWNTQGNHGDGSCPKLDELVSCHNCSEFSSSGRSLFDRQIPDGLLKEWTQILARPKEIEKQGTIPVVVFRLGDEWFCLGAGYFQVAVDVRPIHSIPFRTNKIFLGIANINGELLLCFSLKAVFGIESEEGQSNGKLVYKRMVVVARDNNRFVFDADEVMGIARLQHEDMQTAPSTLSKYANAITSGVFNINNKNVGYLDENKFFESLSRSLSR